MSKFSITASNDGKCKSSRFDYLTNFQSINVNMYEKGAVTHCKSNISKSKFSLIKPGNLRKDIKSNQRQMQLAKYTNKNPNAVKKLNIKLKIKLNRFSSK